MSAANGHPPLTLSKITTVDFHGAQLLAIVGDSPKTTFVVMKTVAEGMGLAWASQLRKIQDHEVISEGTSNLMIPSAGGPQEMICLSLELLPYWPAIIGPTHLPYAGQTADTAASESRAVSDQSASYPAASK